MYFRVLGQSDESVAVTLSSSPKFFGSVMSRKFLESPPMTILTRPTRNTRKPLVDEPENVPLRYSHFTEVTRRTQTTETDPASRVCRRPRRRPSQPVTGDLSTNPCRKGLSTTFVAHVAPVARRPRFDVADIADHATHLLSTSRRQVDSRRQIRLVSTTPLFLPNDRAPTSRLSTTLRKPL